MKTRSILCAIVVLGLFAASWFTARSTRQLAAVSDAINRERLAEASRIRGAAERRRALLERISVAEKELASLERTPAPRHAGKSAEASQRIPTIAERLRTEPDAQILWLKLQRSRVAASYRSLFRKLGLSPEQVVQFEENLIHKQEMQMDLQAISTERQRSTGSAPSEMAELFKRVEVEYASAQKELLGAADFQQLQDYERTTWVRKWVDGWAGGVPIYVGEPLTAEQAEQIVEIMANATENYRRGQAATGPVDWSAVETAARTILTPKQFRFLTTAEPPLPYGGRFQTELYRRVQIASDAESKVAGER
jgi:hypothetical protein